jgi:hypothetical protein
MIISSSETDDAFEFLALEPSRNDSPHFIRDDACVASSDSSIGSDWFDVGVAP